MHEPRPPGRAGARINTIDPNFKNPKYLKATLGYDHASRRNGVVGTIEGLYSRSQNNAFYRNLVSPANPVAQDSHGRQIYGTFTRRAQRRVTRARARRSSTSRTRRATTRGASRASSRSRSRTTSTARWPTRIRVSRDVVSVTSSTAGSNYRYQRDVSGRLDDQRCQVEVRPAASHHRDGTYRFPTFTDVSVIYTGNSGSPYDYVYGSNGGTTGDLNADGQSQNDLMYVPTNATMRTRSCSPATTARVRGSRRRRQAAAMAERSRTSSRATPCLNKARGTIMTRNACRNPVGQPVRHLARAVARQARWQAFENIQVRLDVINFGNLLNKNWGAQAFSDQGSTCGQICSATIVLVHTGNKLPTGVTTSPQAQGIYTFDPAYKAFNADNASSNYRMQLSMRYSF